MHQVSVSSELAADAVVRYGPERSGDGRPSEWDFWSGPLAAALVAFRDFDGLRVDGHPDVRTLHLVDPVFGPIVFVGVRVAPGIVELAAFDDDPDYWDLIADDPVD
jgi:hypothetical protein